MNLAGNTALVTGGTSGVRRALAQSLIAGRRRHLLNEIASATPTRCGQPFGNECRKKTAVRFAASLNHFANSLVCAPAS